MYTKAYIHLPSENPCAVAGGCCYQNKGFKNLYSQSEASLGKNLIWSLPLAKNT